MLDFASSLYLGLRHERASLGDWGALTRGRPAALGEPPGAADVARELAALVGLEGALLSPSTLHLFWDVLGALPPEARLLFDEDLYPVGRWGVERAMSLGVPARPFRHCDPGHLGRLLGEEESGSVPVVVTDGYCFSCGQPAPIGAYAALCRARGAWLFVDDTQPLGVLGSGPLPGSPYGSGGGGSLGYHGVTPVRTVVCASLAKAFGAPLAVLAGPSDFVRSFAWRSDTRVHTSPVSAAHVGAAASALAVNRTIGDRLRGRLLERVSLFRRSLARAGVEARGGSFPVQIVAPGAHRAHAVHGALLARGVETVLLRGTRGAPEIGFVITAAHAPEAIEAAARGLADALGVRGRAAEQGGF